MTGRESSYDPHLDRRDYKTPHRLDQAGAVAVCGVPGCADRAADVVARGVQLHRQGQTSDAAKFRHAVHRPRLPRSAFDHRHHRDHVGHHLLRRRRADQLAGVAHRHAGAADHPCAGDGIVRHAAVPRRGGLGTAGRAQQRAAQPALSRGDRRGVRRVSVQHLSMAGIIFVISCYTFPFVFVLVANALDTMPGELEDASAILGGGAWTTARRVTIPLALPALVAGALIAFLQAITLFGSPAILALPAGFHTMTTKIWSLFQYPPKPELAAAASLPLLVLTVVLLRAEHMILGRRGYSVVGGKQGNPRLVRLGWLNWLALALVFAVLLCPVFLPYGALFNAAFSRVASQFITFDNFTLHNINFVFFELSSTRLAVYNTFVLGIASATIGTILALVIRYVTPRQATAGYRALGFLATAPVAIPGIVLGVALFLSYARPPFVLYGTLWILLIAFVTIALPAAYQQMQSAFRSVHPALEDASRILGATRLRALRDITAPLLRTSV